MNATTQRVTVLNHSRRRAAALLRVNNVLCFPFLFRGALDCGATSITLEMRRACVDAIARLAGGGVILVHCLLPFVMF